MKIFHRIGFFIMAIILTTAVAGCNEPAAMYEMAALDRAYIPALMLTAEPDNSGKSVMAVKELKLEFMIFKSRNADYVGWDDSLGKVEDLIMKADLNINANDHEAAHEALEGIRHEMYILRQDADIKDYLLDRMTEFHEVMEQIMMRLKGKASKTITRDDILRAKELLPKAKERWEAVAASPFNPKVFQFTSGKTERLTAQFGQERDALEKLSKALERQDPAAILISAKEMEEEYVKAFKLFGNFGAVNLGPA